MLQSLRRWFGSDCGRERSDLGSRIPSFMVAPRDNVNNALISGKERLS